MSYRTNDRQKPVDGHEYQRVDTDVWRHVDEVLYRLAPGQAEGPVVQCVVGGSEGHTEHDEE